MVRFGSTKKDKDMRTKEINFKGNIYRCRIVKSKDGEDLLIAPLELLDDLQPGISEDKNEGFVSKEAERIYDEIFFFTNEDMLRISDEDLTEELKQDNEDWF